jgi:hypothetical protein
MDPIYLAFGFTVAAAASLTLPSDREPWTDLDSGLGYIAKWVLSKCDPAAESLFLAAWLASAPERKRLLKYAVFGVILVALLPFHSLCGSDLLIDTLWRVVSTVRSQLNEYFPLFFDAYGHDWRENPFELWEVCVLLWTITVLVNVVVDDVVELNVAKRQNLETMVATGRRAVLIKQALVVVGSCSLIILNSAPLRLGFELMIVSVLLGFDSWLFISYSRAGDWLRTRQFATLMLLADLPVTFAFALLLLFLLSENLRHFESHWSTSFVAGAAALNLLLTSAIVLMLKAIHGYEQELEKSRLKASATRRTTGGSIEYY